MTCEFIVQVLKVAEDVFDSNNFHSDFEWRS